MRYLLNIAHFAGESLIVLCMVSAALAVRRRRDAHRIDILLVVSTLAIANFLPDLGLLLAIKIAAIASLPYLLLRLVRHFRPVPRAWSLGTLVAVPLLTLPFIVTPGFWLGNQRAVVYLLSIPGLAYAAAAFSAEAHKTTGVTARRVRLAAIATWIFVLVFGNSGSVWLPDEIGIPIGRVVILLVGLALVLCSVAFDPPRRLRSGWQRIEQARYLSALGQQDPETRGARAAEDLWKAAVGGVNNTLVLVALRGPTPTGDDFVVRNATDARLVGVEVAPDAPLLAEAVRVRQPLAGSVAGCGEALASVLVHAGTHVLVAPIATEAHMWGAVVVVQRMDSLFLDDDLNLLGDLGRYAASALDHAHLIRDRRERERKAADRRLREVESRMGLMLETIQDYAMLVLDQRGRLVTWPPGAEHVFGASLAEMLDESAAPLFGLSSDEFLMFLADARGRGRAEREGPCRRRDGSRFVGSMVVRPLPSDIDQLEGFVAVVRDVTERRHLEDRVRQTQKLEAIGQLAGGIAHDFNNLLTAILGYSDWLAQDFGGDDPRRLQVAEIQKAGERAAGLTRQLLAFSRRQVMQPTEVSLSRLIGDLVPMLGRVIGEHIQIAGELDPDVAPILADRTQVEQILINLAVNARDAMPDGGRLVIRTASVMLDDRTAGPDAAAGPYALLEVTDSGAGMDAATQEKAFEPFFTTKELGRGTGLGLATVYGIVKQMDGLITLASQPGRGTMFRLYFPDARSRVATSPAASAAPAGGKETLLIVEEDDAVRLLLMQVLERHGYHVLAADAPQAAAAVARAHRAPIDLVITDVMTRGASGPELTRALAAVCPDTPVLYLSGSTDAVRTSRDDVAPASHVLRKPFAPDDLLTRIAQILLPRP